MSDYIKFGENKRECVELAFDEPLTGDNNFGGKQFTYGIKPIITGEDKFSATEKLHEKIQNLGVGKGAYSLIAANIASTSSFVLALLKGDGLPLS